MFVRGVLVLAMSAPLVSQVPQYVTIGGGCPGSLPPSHLIPTSLPAAGGSLQVRIDNLPNDVAFMVTGFSNSISPFGPLPLALDPYRLPGCTLYASPDSSELLIGASNRANYSLPTPHWLAGLHFYQQALVLDTGASNAVGAVVSDAAEAVVAYQAAAPGAIIITEIMNNPSFVPDSHGEWIEVYNTTSLPIDIEGWTLRDDGIDLHVLDNGGARIVIPAGAARVLGIDGNAVTNGGVNVTYAYANFLLANSADEVVLLDANNVEIDRVDYLASWPFSSGVAMNLDPTAYDSVANDDPANWCTATAPWSTTNPDLGTPGAANTTCF